MFRSIFPALFGLVMPHQLHQTMTALSVFSTGGTQLWPSIIFPSADASRTPELLSVKNMVSVFRGFPLLRCINFFENVFSSCSCL